MKSFKVNRTVVVPGSPELLEESSDFETIEQAKENIHQSYRFMTGDYQDPEVVFSSFTDTSRLVVFLDGTVYYWKIVRIQG